MNKYLALPLLFLAGCSQPTTEIQTNDKTLDTQPATAEEMSTESPDFFGEYTIVNDEYGVRTTAVISDGTRTITTNSLPNHETGTFPNPGNPNAITEQDKTYTFTTDPIYTGNATWAREPGIAISGVKFEPETAERMTCSSGETYRIEAIQELTDLGLDFNNAHVQPTGAYHYHGVSQELVAAFASDNDLVHIGFAADGFLIYYSKSGAYKSSYQLSTEPRTGENCSYSTPKGIVVAEYETMPITPDGTYVSDWEYVEGLGELDSCNGINIDGKYRYILTDSFPYTPRCLNGEVQGGDSGKGRGGERPPR